MEMRIEPYVPRHLEAVTRLALRAWAPVFDSIQKSMNGIPDSSLGSKIREGLRLFGMMYEQEKQVAIAAVVSAATLCEQVRRQYPADAMEKRDHSPVTIADFGTQAVICQAIARSFPEDPIMAEETSAMLRRSGMSQQLERVTTAVQTVFPKATPAAVMDWIDLGNDAVAPRYWTLDPIDGTKGYVRGDQYAIALALVEGRDVVLSVMGCPALPLNVDRPEGERGAVFVAARGQGAACISLKTGRIRSIRVSSDPGRDRLIESIESGHGDLALQEAVAQAIGLANAPIKMDSQAKYGVVAAGQAALYMRFPRPHQPDYQENVWDHASGTLLVEEAGGSVSDMDGQPLDFSAGPKLVRNRGIIASNGALHKAVLTHLHAIEARLR